MKISLEKLHSIYGGDAKVLGPYIWKENGRKIIDVKSGGSTKTMLLGRLILELKLGRVLLDDETVDHIDEDPTNDDPSNLQILSREENARKSADPSFMIKWVKDPINQERMSLDKKGERNPLSKLTNSQVEELRSRVKYYGCFKKWSEEFGVTPVTLSDAYHGRTY